VSVETRNPILGLRRSKKEPERPDYSEPDYGYSSSRLDSFVSAGRGGVVVTEPEDLAVLTVVETATPLEIAIAGGSAAPAVPAPDDRPSLEAVLEKLMTFDGALSVALVDSESGMILGKAGSGVDIDLAAAGASTMLRARLASMRALGTDEKIDDLLISLSSQVQIIHPLPSNPTFFTYLIGDKNKSSLAMARYKATEADLQIQL
jgi:predicted regulator of Ras-like GTPase activity (Roadblock/LC7/MglB family)